MLSTGRLYVDEMLNECLLNVFTVLLICSSMKRCGIRSPHTIKYSLLHAIEMYLIVFMVNKSLSMSMSMSMSLVMCYIFHLLIPLLCKTWFYKDCNRNCKNPVLDVIRTLGTSNQAIYYNLLNIYFSLLINLDTLIIMSPKIDAPYLWIRPLDLVPLNLACGLL